MDTQDALFEAREAAVAATLRKLAVAWTEFEGRLAGTPLIRRLERGRLTLQDYRAFLVGLRQQVVDGAAWIARAASSVDAAHVELRSRLLAHAVAEHRDFRLLESDFLACGGDLADIRDAPKNAGSEALSAWMFHEAAKPNPFGLLGAMFIIEGLGAIKATEWAGAIRRQLGLPGEAVRFLAYHGGGDAGHMDEFASMLELVLPDAEVEARIITAARVTGRLYALQIEEILA
jgi:3-oxoacyl-[acyl-carrier-protein] synthase-3